MNRTLAIIAAIAMSTAAHAAQIDKDHPIAAAPAAPAAVVVAPGGEHAVVDQPLVVDQPPLAMPPAAQPAVAAPAKKAAKHKAAKKAPATCVVQLPCVPELGLEW